MLTLIFGWIAEFILNLISLFGYGGVFFAMALESMITPIPSELVMPFGGFLAATGEMNFWLVILAGGLGSLVGSVASYAMGYYGGRPLILKVGKYLLLNEHHLEQTEKFFKRHGEKTIFIGRLIPVVRHLISIPAGLGKMNRRVFALYTFLGATLWCGILTYVGFFLGKNWEVLYHYTHYVSYAFAILIVLGCCYFAIKHLSNFKSKT